MIDDAFSIVFIAVLSSITTLTTQWIMCRFFGYHGLHEDENIDTIKGLRYSINLLDEAYETANKRLEYMSNLQNNHVDFFRQLSEFHDKLYVAENKIEKLIIKDEVLDDHIHLLKEKIANISLQKSQPLNEKCTSSKNK